MRPGGTHPRAAATAAEAAGGLWRGGAVARWRGGAVARWRGGVKRARNGCQPGGHVMPQPMILETLQYLEIKHA
jgi:hypothetical protein